MSAQSHSVLLALLRFFRCAEEMEWRSAYAIASASVLHR
jgi:hypothetical protein